MESLKKIGSSCQNSALDPVSLCLVSLRLSALLSSMLCGAFSSLGAGAVELVSAERGSLPPRCSKDRLVCHWSSLCPMLAPDPATGMQGSDGPGLERGPTQVVGGRAGPCRSQVLSSLGGGTPREKWRAVVGRWEWVLGRPRPGRPPR